jgi:hypothetical protein
VLFTRHFIITTKDTEITKVGLQSKDALPFYFVNQKAAKGRFPKVGSMHSGSQNYGKFFLLRLLAEVNLEIERTRCVLRYARGASSPNSCTFLFTYPTMV